MEERGRNDQGDLPQRKRRWRGFISLLPIVSKVLNKRYVEQKRENTGQSVGRLAHFVSNHKFCGKLRHTIFIFISFLLQIMKSQITI